MNPLVEKWLKESGKRPLTDEEVKAAMGSHGGILIEVDRGIPIPGTVRFLAPGRPMPKTDAERRALPRWPVVEQPIFRLKPGECP